jgi:hypothetical protein
MLLLLLFLHGALLLSGPSIPWRPVRLDKKAGHLCLQCGQLVSCQCSVGFPGLCVECTTKSTGLLVSQWKWYACCGCNPIAAAAVAFV